MGVALVGLVRKDVGRKTLPGGNSNGLEIRSSPTSSSGSENSLRHAITRTLMKKTRLTVCFF